MPSCGCKICSTMMFGVSLSTGVSRNIANGACLKWIAISVLRVPDMRLPVRR